MKISRIEAINHNILPSKLKVCAYCRVSTASDAQHDSLEAQKTHYESFIRKNPEWEFAGIYSDSDITGTKADCRDGLQAMLNDCWRGKISHILTKSISRFSINKSDCLSLVRELLDIGVTIYFEKENIDTGSMESELLLSVHEKSDENAQRIRTLQELLNQNSEKRDILRKLRSQEIMDSAVFSREVNFLKKQSDAYRIEIASLKEEDSDEIIVSEIRKLLKFVEKEPFQEEFKEELFTEFAEKIIVYDRHLIGFHLKCGLILKEELE